MNEVSDTPEQPKQQGVSRVVKYIAPAIVLILLFAGFTAYNVFAEQPPAASEPVPPPAPATSRDAGASLASLGAQWVCSVDLSNPADTDPLLAMMLESGVKLKHTISKTVSKAVLEKDYGIRLTLVAVTAAGGIVDLRFKVLDLNKAKTLLSDEHSMPMVMIGDNNEMLRGPAMMHGHNYKNGGAYFFHFANGGGVVKRGTYVRPMIGTVQIEPVRVQ